MKLYLTRHGQSQWNILNKVSGITDVALTPDGEIQAHKTAQKLKDKNITILYSSPLIRAKKTAEIIGKEIGIQAENIILDKRLIEQDYGVFEGVPRDDEGFLTAKKQFAFRYPGGESMMQLAGRVYPLLDEIKDAYPNKNVLIVSHGGISRVIHSYFFDLSNDEYYKFTMENCEVLEYSFWKNKNQMSL